MVPPLLTGVGWWRVLRRRSDHKRARRAVTGIGLIAITAAVATPWVIVSYNAWLFSSGRPVGGHELLDGITGFNASFLLAAVSVPIGALAPPGVRWLIVTASLIHV